MFVGHAAVAAFAGATRPRLPMLPLFLAAYGADGLEIALHGLRFDHAFAMQWSHSIVSMLAGGLVFGAAALAAWRRADVALLTGLVYASHWACDVITGENKPTWLGGPALGFGLYEVPAADFAIEAVLVVAAGVAYQWRRPTRTRRIILGALVLVVLQLGFNLGDRGKLHGLKQGLGRVSGAALAPAMPSRPASRG